MGVESVTAWITVRRYDQLGSNLEDLSESSPLPIELQQDSSFADLKCQVQAWIGLPQDDRVVMKLRRFDGTLVTLSSLLNGSSESEPFILEIARIHQNVPASQRSAFSPSYVESIRNKLKYLEKRVERVETLIPELRSRRQASIEQITNQLGSKVNFLDKRLDELTPQEWKEQLK